MRNYALAMRYANALFDIAPQKTDLLSEFNVLMAEICCAKANSKDFKVLLDSPLFELQEKENVVSQLVETTCKKESLSSEAKTTMISFFTILINKNRINLINEIYDCFSNKLDKATGVMRGTLCSAIVLSDEKKQSIISTLESAFKSKLILEYTVDASILGGIKLQLHDHVLDASLETQLNILRNIIKQGETCV